MSITATLTAADTIIFAINSAIKLSRNLRHAYVKKVQEKELVLPLPDYNPDITLETINFFFDGNKSYLSKWDELRRLRQNANDQDGLTEEEKIEYQQYYLSLRHCK